MNRKIILHKRPLGTLNPDNFRLLEEPRPDFQSGKLLLKGLFFSVDPYMRNRMNAFRSYIEPYDIGRPISGDAIAEVIKSDLPEFQTGDLVTGSLPWQEYMLMDPSRVAKIDNMDISPTAFLSVLGLTGLTAYFGVTDIGRVQSGDQVVISAAAGAVGSVAGQIARILGCRVTGITGSEQKVKYIIDDLHFDEAINYKSHPNIRKALVKSNPKGIDMYFDNVGGDISDSIMYLLNTHARIALCGQISLYDQSRISTGPRLNAQLIVKRARMEGFIVYDYKDRYPEAMEVLKKWIREGELKYRETIIDGFENLPSALMGLFKGKNIGKQLVKVN